jgi:hypothetical protein
MNKVVSMPIKVLCRSAAETNRLVADHDMSWTSFIRDGISLQEPRWRPAEHDLPGGGEMGAA